MAGMDLELLSGLQALSDQDASGAPVGMMGALMGNLMGAPTAFNYLAGAPTAFNMLAGYNPELAMMMGAGMDPATAAHAAASWVGTHLAPLVAKLPGLLPGAATAAHPALAALAHPAAALHPAHPLHPANWAHHGGHHPAMHPAMMHHHYGHHGMHHGMHHGYPHPGYPYPGYPQPPGYWPPPGAPGYVPPPAAPISPMAQPTPLSVVQPEMPGVPDRGGRVQPLGFENGAFTAAGPAVVTVRARPQRPIRGGRIVGDFTRTGVSATGLLTLVQLVVATDGQLLSGDPISFAALSPNAFGVGVNLSPAAVGNEIFATVATSALPVNNDRIDFNLTLFGLTVG